MEWHVLVGREAQHQLQARCVQFCRSVWLRAAAFVCSRQMLAASAIGAQVRTVEFVCCKPGTWVSVVSGTGSDPARACVLLTHVDMFQWRTVCAAGCNSSVTALLKAMPHVLRHARHMSMR